MSSTPMKYPRATPALKQALLALMLLLIASLATAQTLKIGAVPTRPPYVFAERHQGIELDIAREALRAVGYEVEFSYMPYKRRLVEMERGTLDGIMTLAEESGLQAHFSAPYIEYQNVVISLRERNLRIERFDDLLDQRVSAFVGASQYLGEEFTRMAAMHPRYEEMTLIESIPALLFKRRTDVVVMEVNVFGYYRRISQWFDGNIPVVVHPLFPKTPYKMAFHSRQVRDDFDRGLELIRASGLYERIWKNYLVD